MKLGPFNFYQQITGLIFSEDAPTPFGLFNINESGLFGVYFPQDVALGRPMPLFEDGDSSPQYLKIKQYGDVDREWKEIYSYSLGQSGDLFPAPPDSGSYSFSISGNITGNQPDIFTFSIPWSGNVQSIPLDNPLFIIKHSGSVTSCPLDKGLLSLSFTGQLNNFQNDFEQLSIKINGNLRKVQYDSQFTTFSLSDVIFDAGLDKIVTNISDSGSLSFIINTISFDRA